MFKIKKQIKNERKDAIGAKYIKYEDGRILVNEKETKERWRQYFETLLNEENPHVLKEEEKVEGTIEDVSEEEASKALNETKRRKALGSSGITSDLILAAGQLGIWEITKNFKKIMKEGRVPEDLEESLTVKIFKGKGDAMNPGNYRGIRLLEHSMEVWEKVLEARQRNLAQIKEIQFGFQPQLMRSLY